MSAEGSAGIHPGVLDELVGLLQGPSGSAKGLGVRGGPSSRGAGSVIPMHREGLRDGPERCTFTWEIFWVPWGEEKSRTGMLLRVGGSTAQLRVRLEEQNSLKLNPTAVLATKWTCQSHFIPPKTPHTETSLSTEQVCPRINSVPASPFCSSTPNKSPNILHFPSPCQHWRQSPSCASELPDRWIKWGKTARKEL